MVRNTYFKTRDGFPYGSVQKFAPKVVTDLSVGYDITKKLNFTVGANNLFDVFPDLQVYENSYLEFSNMHPFKWEQQETISSED